MIIGVNRWLNKFLFGSGLSRLGFSLKDLSKEEIALFEGSGKTMKHIEIGSLKEIDEKKIVKLLKLIKKK